MNFEPFATVNLGLKPQAMWLWYCSRTDCFLVGDAQRAFSLPVSNPAAPAPLQAARQFPRDVPIRGTGGVPTIEDMRRKEAHPFNLPIPDSLYDSEFPQSALRGLYFLPRSAFDHVAAEDPAWLGDLVGTLCAGHPHRLYMLHRPSNLVLSLQSGSMQLSQQSSAGFTLLDEARTRGRRAMAFAAHPDEPFVVYVDNNGSSFAHEFSANKFGKARKIDAWTHGGRAVEFMNGGRALLVGGTGHLAAYGYAGNKFSKRHEIAVAVRDLNWIEDQRILLVNQGMHGVWLYRVEEEGFTPSGVVKHEAAVKKVAVSKDMQYMAMTDQDSANVRVYRLSQP